jgi:lipoyl-dependent peroxiredoxin
VGKTIYTAEAHVTGGRIAGHGRTSDGALEVDLRVPPELGGTEPGTNPEQLLSVGFGACFESALAAVSRRRKIEAGDVEVDSKVMLVTGEARVFTVEVELDVTLPSVEREDAVELVRDAHRVCPFSNATRGNVAMKLSANGTPVEISEA